MTPTRIRVLLLVAIAALGVTWAVLRGTYSDLPPLPWTAIPTLILMTIGEAYTGVLLRARIQRRPGTRPVIPMAVARTAALAKATALVAALMAGIAGGFIVTVATSLSKPAPRHDMIVSVGTLLAAIALAGGALFLEYCCRVPGGPGTDEDEDQDSGPDPFSGHVHGR